MDKRVLTVQDVSCVGQCSLTVALPIISAFGIETAIIPSAVLSTHTGGFKNFTFRDLTEDLPLIEKHWISEKIKFDYFYTGYVGSAKQLEYISGIFKSCANDGAVTVVDPVMGDKGKLYVGFDDAFAKNMAKFCGNADVILPNLTEAAFMLGEEYVESGYDKAYIEGMLKKLKGLGAKRVVLTGVMLEKGKIGVAVYDGSKFEYYFNEYLPVQMHGTGDVFASAFVGSLARGKSDIAAAKIAADFVVDCIKATIGDDSHWYGVKFEKALPNIFKYLT